MSPQRIQRKRTKGWRMPEGAVYVGRGTKWGNPFRLRREGGFQWIEDPKGIGPAHMGCSTDRDGYRRQLAQEAVDLYNLHVGPLGAYEIPDADIEQLRGKDLMCWCPLDQACHADVLLRLANEDS